MKQFKPIIFLFFILSLSFTSCLKKGDANIDVVDKTSNVLQLQFVNGGATINSGLQYFAGGALTYPATEASHTADLNVSVNGAFDLSQDLPVTLAVDPAKAKDYFATDKIAYEIMPDSLYHFSSMSVTIPAAARVAPLKITFFPSKIDPTKSYILPVVIKDGGGQTISGNFATIYFHVIGNPLAGTYNVVGTRYNYTGVVGYTGGTIPTSFVSTAASPTTKVASPNSPTQIALDYANLGSSGYSYLVSYDPATPTTVGIAGNAALLAALSNFTVFVHTYDPATKKIHIVTSYNNGAGGSGSDRIIDETFTHK